VCSVWLQNKIISTAWFKLNGCIGEQLVIFGKNKFSMEYIVYGLPNCDVTKKATKWLDEHQVPYKLHNYKTEGISIEKLEEWCKQKGWELLLNKRGTTFKALHPAVQQNASTEKAAIEIMQAQTSTIKRPVIEKGDKVVAVAFDEKKYEIAFL
jgi:arsenate reductase